MYNRISIKNQSWELGGIINTSNTSSGNGTCSVKLPWLFFNTKLLRIKQVKYKHMTVEFNPNLLFPNDKSWIEIVNKNFDELITVWIKTQKCGELTTEDIIKVVEKIAKIRNDDSLVSIIKQRIRLI